MALAISLSLATAGLLGLSIHSSYLYAPLPPSPSAGSALNVLLASLTLFFSLEAAWLSLGGVPIASGLYAARCRSTCTLLPLLAVPVLATLYVIGYRLDAAAWCVPLFAALLLSAQRAAPSAPPAAAPLLARPLPSAFSSLPMAPCGAQPRSFCCCCWGALGWRQWAGGASAGGARSMTWRPLGPPAPWCTPGALDRPTAPSAPPFGWTLAAGGTA